MEYHQKETLERLYWGEEMSLPDIGNKFGVSHVCILNWMNRHEIPRRERTAEKPPHFGKDDRGYERFVHVIGGERQQVYHHRLLAVAKYGFEAVRDRHVHHKNGCKYDNRLENIELLTNSEHARKHGLKRGGLNE